MISLDQIHLKYVYIFIRIQQRPFLSLCQINMNLDVRLIQVNERLVKHKLLVAVADCLQNCTGHMQVIFNSKINH